jgi:pimeloyl-ACP methyl ester carboxylesterase
MGWCLQGGFDNDPTSHAVPDQHGGRQGERLHDFRNVSPVSLDGAFDHRTWACAMSTQIRRESVRIGDGDDAEGDVRHPRPTPYLDMLRARVPSVQIEIIEDTGHFPQIDESGQTNALLDSFLASLRAS